MLSTSTFSIFSVYFYWCPFSQLFFFPSFCQFNSTINIIFMAYHLLLNYFQNTEFQNILSISPFFCEQIAFMGFPFFFSIFLIFKISKNCLSSPPKFRKKEFTRKYLLKKKSFFGGGKKKQKKISILLEIVFPSFLPFLYVLKTSCSHNKRTSQSCGHCSRRPRQQASVSFGMQPSFSSTTFKFVRLPMGTGTKETYA